ncbi:MAG: IS21 family transposase [Deltaproteobacteria bacterium]|nr:IS21 family transposase [Deltaproteobacteria bacterium]
MRSTDGQVRRLMEELSRHGKIGVAALRAGMHPATARKYRELGKLPSEVPMERDWRTREDPFEKEWPLVHGMLKDAPELEAKSLFEWLCGQTGRSYQEGQLRTFQRGVREWRALHGPPREVFFPQEHRPGEALQTDFTWATELGVTIGGELFEHMLCHPVLPYSNWEWATVCRSESLAALKGGIQAALVRLGRVPEFSQTDNSTSATHTLSSGKRGFNDNYVSLVDHFGMKPRTTGVGKKEQNGDVEALNGALKRRVKQHLLLRGSSDFESVEEYETWLGVVLTRANALRTCRLADELAVMKPLRAKRLPEYTEDEFPVSCWSTIRVLFNSYSVPSRLIDERVKVRIYEDRLEVYYKDVLQLTTERLVGRNGRRIDYRHVIWSLVRKPGAFPRYKYREEFFPSVIFRKAYDILAEALASERQADINYLRILHLAASEMECEVETALELLLEQGTTPLADEVKELVKPREPELPEIPVPRVDL